MSCIGSDGPLLCILGELVERRRLVVGNGVHADRSELRAGQPLDLLQGSPIITTSRAERRQPTTTAGYDRWALSTVSWTVAGCPSASMV